MHMLTSNLTLRARYLCRQSSELQLWLVWLFAAVVLIDPDGALCSDYNAYTELNATHHEHPAGAVLPRVCQG